MKNITLSADAHLIELAREEARARKTTLNALFREWIEDLSARDARRTAAQQAIEGLRAHVTSIPKFTRKEMNER